MNKQNFTARRNPRRFGFMLATDVGTVLEGKEAVLCGLIDHIGGLSDALDALKDMIEN